MADKVTMLRSTGLLAEIERIKRERMVWRAIALCMSAIGFLFVGVLPLLGWFPKSQTRTCPLVVEELASCERLSEMYQVWYHQERKRTEEYRTMAKQLLRDRGLPDNVPELPPARAAAP